MHGQNNIKFEDSVICPTSVKFRIFVCELKEMNRFP